MRRWNDTSRFPGKSTEIPEFSASSPLPIRVELEGCGDARI
jgi:hypothetical protein